MQRPSAPYISTTYPVGTLVASAPAPTFTPIATHSACFCSVSCCTTASINIPGVLSRTLAFARFTHTWIECNYLCILFFGDILYFVLPYIIIMVFFTLCVLCFCFFASISSVMACTLFRTITLLQTYSTYSYYCFAFHCVWLWLWLYLFGLSRSIYRSNIVCSRYAIDLLVCFFDCLIHRPLLAVYFNIYGICFVALLGQKRTNFYVLLCFTPYYCMFIHQQL